MSEKTIEKLKTTLEEVSHSFDNPPPNEANTCDWVIRPLLLDIGYENREILSQAANAENRYPDYTILPNTEHTWYLEAKDWNKNLDSETDIVQAINYANAAGKRWVVLSNGREWMLFDNHLSIVAPAERLVAKSDVQDEGFIDFIMALSKDSMASGRIALYSATWKLREVLRKQLKETNSPAVQALLRSLRKETGLSQVTAADIVSYFSEKGVDSTPANIAQDDLLIAKPKNDISPLSSGNQETKSLKELDDIKSKMAGSKPLSVTFFNKEPKPVTYWTDVCMTVVEWISDNYGLPKLPFKPLYSKYFINHEPVSSDNSKMISHRSLRDGDDTVYINVNCSVYAFIQNLKMLCDAVEAPAEQINIAYISKN